MKRSILRTHGGLGNQLFQILYGRLFSQSGNLKLNEIHDSNYQHSFQRSNWLTLSGEPPQLQRFISFCRLPKIIQRIFKTEEKPISIMNDIYLDGYFQKVEYYKCFNPELIKKNLITLKKELRIPVGEKNGKFLVHLRLGDFFKSQNQAEDHARERLMKVPVYANVITNDELLLKRPMLVEIIKDRKIELLESNMLCAEEVLIKMANFSRIDANGSTLSVWCSILNDCDVSITIPRIRALRDYIKLEKL